MKNNNTKYTQLRLPLEIKIKLKQQAAALNLTMVKYLEILIAEKENKPLILK